MEVKLPDLKALRAERKPVFCHYPRQCSPQPAVIELNLKTGSVYCTYNGDPGWGTPVEVYNREVRWYGIPSDVSGRKLAQLLKKLGPLLQEVLDNVDGWWPDDWLTEEFLEAEGRLVDEIQGFFPEYTD